MSKGIKLTFLLIGILGIIYYLITLILPARLDKKYNTVASKPPYQVSDHAKNLYHSLDFVSDWHCDVLLWKRNILERHDYGHVDIPRMIEANMGIEGFTIVTKSPSNLNFDKNTGDTDDITAAFIAQGRAPKTWFNLTNRAVDQCNRLHTFAKKSDGKFRVIETKMGLKKYLHARTDNKKITAGFLGVEGAHALEGELKNVQVLFDAGVRMMGPVHFFDNKLGASAHGVSHGGITEFGIQVIKKMENLGMIVDLSHASPALVDDIFKIATRPVVYSHVGVKGTCNNVRNASDENLKKVAELNGLIGIAMFEKADCGTDAAATAAAIKYAVDVAGISHVALGSDFDGAIKCHFDVTGLPLIVDELIKLGFSDNEIRMVMSENSKRFLLENLPD